MTSLRRHCSFFLLCPSVFNWLQQCSAILGTLRYIILRSCRHRRVITRQALVLVARQSGNELQLNSGWIWGQRGGVTSPTYPPDTHVSLAPPACHCKSCVWLTHNSFALKFLHELLFMGSLDVSCYISTCENTLLLCVILLTTKYSYIILYNICCTIALRGQLEK